jgi:hypothetical protein
MKTIKRVMFTLFLLVFVHYAALGLTNQIAYLLERF